MRITQKLKKFDICGDQFEIKRDQSGVPVFWVKDVPDFCKVMGFLHAHDRMIQMMMVKVISQGRVCELLKSTAENLEVDIFIRELGFAEQAKREIDAIDANTLKLMQNYCDGVNGYVDQHGYPFEFRLAGFKPDRWCPEDTLSSVKLMSYSGLAQTQQDIEKVILQAIKQGADLEKLKSLFSPHLDGVDGELVELLGRAHVVKHMVPKAFRFLSAVPKIMASNNWVVGAKKSKSGKVIQCNDPHLECNRLPGVWYEFVGHIGDGFCMGVNIPGVPGLTMGRTENFGLSFTYGFMDMVDFFLEEIKDGKYRDGDEFKPLIKKTHKIKRKKSDDFEFTTYHTPRGLIEMEPQQPLKNGIHLSRCWAGDFTRSEKSLKSNFALLTARSALQASRLVCNIGTSCNWILADKSGQIIFQQSGAFPNRSHSGLYPIPAWIQGNPWSGLRDTDALATVIDPEENFFCTANNDLNQKGKPLSINMPMGSYRVDRIRQLLQSKGKLDVEDMKEIQTDLYSLHAEKYMRLIKPHLLSGEMAELLTEWDLKYDCASFGATLFEKIYDQLLANLFGRDFLSTEVWQHLQKETAMIVDFYHVFDRVLLEAAVDDGVWFRRQNRDQYLIEAIQMTFDGLTKKEIAPWGKTREVMMTNIFFQGALPSFLGFDKGPYPIAGGRATVCQGAVYRAHGRVTTFCPSHRFISDFSTNEAHTVLAGGPSDRRFSKYYASDVNLWQNFKYKKLTAASGREE